MLWEGKGEFMKKFIIITVIMVAIFDVHSVALAPARTREKSVHNLITVDGQPRSVNGVLALNNKLLTSLEGLQEIKNPELVITLDLSSNRLTTIPVGAFDNMVNLKRLILKNNRLQNLPPKVFSTIQLDLLDLQNNGIQETAGQFKKKYSIGSNIQLLLLRPLQTEG